ENSCASKLSAGVLECRAQAEKRVRTHQGILRSLCDTWSTVWFSRFEICALGRACRTRKKCDRLIGGNLAKVTDNPVCPIAGQSARAMAIDAKYQRKPTALPSDYTRNCVFRDACFARICGRGELEQAL